MMDHLKEMLKFLQEDEIYINAVKIKLWTNVNNEESSSRSGLYNLAKVIKERSSCI